MNARDLKKLTKATVLYDKGNLKLAIYIYIWIIKSIYIYMDNQKVKKEKARPYETEEERKVAIRRSKPVTCFRKCGIVKYVIVSIV